VDDDVIDVAAGTYTENVTLPARRLTLQGAGAGVTVIDGSGSASPTLDQSTGARLSLTGVSLRNGASGLTISGSRAEITAVEIANNTFRGIWSVLSALTITDTSVTDNYAGIYLDRSRARLTGCTINQNAAIGVQGNRSPTTIDRSVIESNDTGIYFYAKRLTVRDSTIAQNSGGGGIQLGSATAKLSGTTISNNTGTAAGGVDVEVSTFRCTNCTVSGNQGENDGGIRVFGGNGLLGRKASAQLKNCTVASNVGLGTYTGGAGGLYIYNGQYGRATNTIFADNTGPAGNDCSGDFYSKGYNLIEDTTGCTITGSTEGNILGVDPMLGPLADNGGPTETHALLAGSAAIDAGDPNRCLPTDQRGVVRTPPCDIGAYEAP
jgi:hypothetical protein